MSALIFISHTSSEAALAIWLKEWLQKAFGNHLDIFVSSDGTTIQAGVEWLIKLRASLERTDIGIILCSKTSIAQPWVNFEAGAIWLRRITLIPACHSEMRLADLPAPLNLLQAVDMGTEPGLRLLYNTVASKLQISSSPDEDFAKATSQVQSVTRVMQEAITYRDRVIRPKILILISNNFLSKYYQGDINAVKRAFSDVTLTIREGITSRELRQLLTNQEFDIIHLALEINGENGELNLDCNNNGVEFTDRVTAEGFARLAKLAKAKLIVMATCHSLPLAVDIAPFANVIATNFNPSGRQLEPWLEFFYELLSQGRPLFEAFDITHDQGYDVSMRLVRNKDIIFQK
jgi:hypothetical protein